MSEIRLLYRLMRFGAHLLLGCLKVALLFPWASVAQKKRWIQRWSRQLLAICAVECIVEHHSAGMKKMASGNLLVANHVSWLDVFVINAWQPVGFVCKDEVAQWPLIGWLVASTGGLFLRRGSRQAAQHMAAQMARQMKKGQGVAVFPEGTSSEGFDVLPFKSALFQAAIDAKTQVQPLSIRYTDENGHWRAAASYAADTTLWQSLLALLCQRHNGVTLTLLPNIIAASMTRQALAEASWQVIQASVRSPQTTDKMAINPQQADDGNEATDLALASSAKSTVS